MQLITDMMQAVRLDSVPAPAARELTLNPVEILVEDVIKEILFHLDLKTLNSFCLASKKWCKFVDDNNVWKAVIYRTLAFNKEKYAKQGWDIGTEPLLPVDIRNILKESHRMLLVHRAKMLKQPVENVRIDPVQKLFKLVVVPEKINGQPFEAEMFGELVKTPKEGNKSCYEYFWPNALAEHGKKAPDKSYWMLITKTVIEGSRNKPYADQQVLVATLPGFEIPKALEAIVVNFTEYVETGMCLYGRAPWTYTRCQESTQGYQLAVGGFVPSGLGVHDNIDFCIIGVAALRKF